MVSPVKMTKKEKIKMYRTRSKKELAKMLYAANEQLSERGLKITFPDQEVIKFKGMLEGFSTDLQEVTLSCTTHCTKTPE